MLGAMDGIHSLQGRTALVTGATAGIGFHTAIGLASKGAQLFVTARHEEAGQRAIAEIRRRAGHDRIELLIADAASVQATRALADRISQRVRRLDILVNNVGGVFDGRRETVDGLELTLAVNFVAPFGLTTRLLPLLSRSDSGRVVNVVSSAFSMWKGSPFDDLNLNIRQYVGIEAYARAKLLALLFTLQLARDLAESSMVVNAVNPGMAWTPGIAALTPRAVPRWRYIWPIVRWFQRRASAESAARAPVRVATSPDLARLSGRYFDGRKETRLPPHILDETTQRRAWDLGERLLADAVTITRPPRSTALVTGEESHGRR